MKKFTNFKRNLFFLLAILLFNANLFSQSIIYVKADATTGSNNGTSWTDAYTDLQTALSNATAGDTIWVAAGTYIPSVPSGINATFQMIKEVEMYGGFSGAETLLSQRDYITNKTILSGDIGVSGDITDNVNHVVTGIDSTKIDGFVIQDGYADILNAGGGMYNYVGGNDIENLSILNCTFKNNYAKNTGMALYNSHVVNMLISNCTFEYNNYTNTADGGGIYNDHSTLSIYNCNFNHNTTKNGGAIFNNYSTATISNCEFISNTCDENGGAINDYLCASKIFNSIFSYNHANNYGGGIYDWAATGTNDSIVNCTFYLNYGNTKGGAIVDKDDPSVITNSIFMDNGSDEPTYIEKTFYNVTGTYSAIVNYSCVYGNDYTGTGNIRIDPKFVDKNSDWHLKPGSPCIDAGNGDVATATDLDNNSRYDDFSIINTGTGNPNYVDMGAYECQQNSPMHGTFNIGASAPIFHSFQQAVDSMLNLSIDGAVTFTVQTGTYNEQVTLPGVVGESETNTITFQSATGDSTDVILTYASTDQNNNYTLKLDSADYVTFKGITLQATGTTYARIVELDHGACSNIFTNNQFLGLANTSELVHSDRLGTETESPDTSNSFLNNRFENGAVGISFTSVITGTGTTVENNEFINQSDTAVYFKYFSHSKILSNYIHSNSPSTGIYLTQLSDGDTISNNIIQLNAGGNGINLYYCYKTSSDTNLISNNFVYLNTINSDHGINIYYTSTAIKLLNNTVHITGDSSGSYCLYYDPNGVSDNKAKTVLNNIFANETKGQAVYYHYTPTSDYNNLYSNGQYLINNQDLAWWQDNFNQDLHSITVNPYFTADTSWHVQNRALNGAGTPLSAVTTDIDGEPRDANNPDIGADEFTPSLNPMHGIYTIGGISPNFTSINNAVDSLSIRGVDGTVTINIASGTYNEQISIQGIPGASSTNTITFQSATGDSTDVIVRYKPTLTYKDYTWQLDGVDYLSISKMTITIDTTFGSPIKMVNSATFNNISSNYIYVNTFDNILVNDVNDPIDSNNVFIGNYFENGNVGIQIQNGSSKNTQIKNNVFNNLSFRGVDISGQENIEISENIINVSATTNYSYGIYCSSNMGYITNNMIQLNTNNHPGYGIYSSSTGDFTIANNTVKINGGSSALSITGNSIKVINNVLINPCSKVFSLSDTTSCTIDYNVYYSANETSIIEGITNNSLKYWQDNYGFDLHSIYYNPVFVTDINLHTFDPWLNNRGIPVAEITTDIDGELKNATHPDIGADEFNGVSPLKGVYTIGATGNFENFTKAVDTLNYCGVEDSVIFNIQAGTYNDQFTLSDSNITRMPDTSVIVFESLTKDSTDVILQYKANAANNYIINLDSASYISIKNMTLQALDSTYSVAIQSRSSSHDTISNNVLIGAGNTSPVIYSPNGVDEFNCISNNRIKNGKSGILWIGEDNTHEQYNTFNNNTLTNQYSGGIFANYQYLSNISNNKITHLNPVQDTTWVGIALLNSNGHHYYDSYSNLINEYNNIANNTISFQATGKSAGIHSYSSDNLVVYNSINIFGNNATESRAINIENSDQHSIFKNNIFYNNAGGLVYYTTSFNYNCDYNDVYTNGDNFAYKDNFIANRADWVSTSNKDHNSISIIPPYLSNNDLHLSPTLQFQAGTPINGITTDIDGEQRNSTTPFIGADEYVIPCNGALAGSYIIGTTGDYANFTDAVFALNTCGIDSSVVFNVQPGTYNEQVLINNSAIISDSTAWTITFQSISGDSSDVILQYEADSINNYVLSLKNPHNLIFNNLTLQALDTTYGRVIVLQDSINNFTLNNCRILGVETNSDNENLACIFAKNINPDDTMTVNIKYNYIANGSYGFYTEDYHYFYYDIAFNYFENQRKSSVQINNSPEYSTNNLNTVVLTNNTVYNTNNPSKGFYIGYLDSTLILYNKIYIETNVDNSNSIENYSSNNLIANNFMSIKATTSNNVFGYSSTWTSNIFYNSIFIFGNGGYFSSCIDLAGSGVDIIKNNNLVNLVSDRTIYNNNYSTTTSDYNNLFSTSSYFDFNNWQTSTGLDAHSVTFMPDFVSDTDLHTNSVLLYQAGIAIPEVTTDIDGETRNNPPCIGADEFSNPTFNLGDDKTVCVDAEYKIDAGVGFDTYLWSTGADSSYILVDSTGIGYGSKMYYVTVSLDGNDYNDSIAVTFSSPTATPITDYCVFDSVLITAGEGMTYNWSTGDTTQSIYVGLGNYSVTVTDANGCSDNGYIYTHYNSHPANINISDTTICRNQSVTLTANNSDNCSYYWSTGDTTQSIIVDSLTYGMGSHTYYVTAKQWEK